MQAAVADAVVACLGGMVAAQYVEAVLPAAHTTIAVPATVVPDMAAVSTAAVTQAAVAAPWRAPRIGKQRDSVNSRSIQAAMSFDRQVTIPVRCDGITSTLAQSMRP